MPYIKSTSSSRITMRFRAQYWIRRPYRFSCVAKFPYMWVFLIVILFGGAIEVNYIWSRTPTSTEKLTVGRTFAQSQQTQDDHDRRIRNDNFNVTNEITPTNNVKNTELDEALSSYRRPIPDVSKWQDFPVGDGRVKLDPRLREEDFVGDVEFDWDAPYHVTEEEDPVGIFRRKMEVAMDDPVLIRYLKEVVLIPPSELPYNLSEPSVEDPSEYKGTSEVLRDLLQATVGTKKGVFFEAGVLNGETASRSLYLERHKGWTGLTVEMTWPNIRRFLNKHRKCWFAPVCLSPYPYPVKKHMRFAYNPDDPWLERTGTINKKKWDKEDADKLAKRQYIYTLVDCFPLYSLLLAANMTHVDFFNIDLEGVELQVLKTVPFDKVDLSVVVVEVLHTEEGRESVREFMAVNGYRKFNQPVNVLHLQLANTYFHEHEVFVKRR